MISRDQKGISVLDIAKSSLKEAERNRLDAVSIGERYSSTMLGLEDEQ